MDMEKSEAAVMRQSIERDGRKKVMKIGIIKKLTTNEQVRDIEKVGLAGSSLAPACLRVKVGILILATSNHDLRKRKEKRKKEMKPIIFLVRSLRNS